MEGRAGRAGNSSAPRQGPAPKAPRLGLKLAGTGGRFAPLGTSSAPAWGGGLADLQSSEPLHPAVEDPLTLGELPGQGVGEEGVGRPEEESQGPG